MHKPPMPGMTDTLEFVKNLWGGMHIPGAMPGMSAVPGMPPLPGAGMSVEDLDKKIADLKAVEAWLSLNQNMLHASIQALEVQRGTLSTLKAMGDSMAQAMGQSGAAGEPAVAPFAQFFTQMAQATMPAASAAPATPPAPAPAQAAPPAPAPATAAPHTDTPQSDAAGAAMPAAVAWWNLLQDQFRHAVASAMPAEGAAGADDANNAPSSAATAAPQTQAGEPAAPFTAGKGNPAPAKRNARGKADKA